MLKSEENDKYEYNGITKIEYNFKVIIRPSSKVIIRFLTVMMKHGYIGEFEIVDDHRAGKIVVNLTGRINKCQVIRLIYFGYNIYILNIVYNTVRIKIKIRSFQRKHKITIFFNKYFFQSSLRHPHGWSGEMDQQFASITSIRLFGVNNLSWHHGPWRGSKETCWWKDSRILLLKNIWYLRKNKTKTTTIHCYMLILSY